MNKNILGSTLALIANVNPFLMINEDGNPLKAADAKEAYFKLFVALYKDFPCGFIDLPYFMVQHQRINLTEAEKCCGMHQYAMLSWMRDLEDRNKTLRRICEKMLEVSGVPFDDSAFWGAVSSFSEFMILYKNNQNHEKE